MAFKVKKIKNHNNLGKKLQEARYKTGLSLKMVARHININKTYLEALENGDWHKLPGEIYAKSFLKRYCQFLKLDPEKIKIDFNKTRFLKRESDYNFRKKTNKWSFLILPRVLKTSLLILITLFILLYLVWQINQIISPPEITLLYPTADLATRKSTLIITGQTEKEVKIKINNEEVILNKDNTFKQTINLQPGLNVIKIEGKKKYSKKKMIERKVVYEP